MRRLLRADPKERSARLYSESIRGFSLLIDWPKGVEKRLHLRTIVIGRQTAAKRVVKLVVDNAKLPSAQPAFGDGIAVVLRKEIDWGDCGVASRVRRRFRSGILVCLRSKLNDSSKDRFDLSEGSFEFAFLSIVGTGFQDAEQALDRHGLLG